MTDTTHETATRIAALNDLLRKGGVSGTVYFTSGVRERGQAFVIDALRAGDVGRHRADGDRVVLDGRN